ncbi:MAG TPA: helix-turn-helix domain-containing protein [Spirochaetia bacterium]|nr:helix-turn-helix domain-containing protein [Spirochaetia bacterium]
MPNPDEVERECMMRALARWEGNRTRAAEELGISRRIIFYKIKRYGLE